MTNIGFARINKRKLDLVMPDRLDSIIISPVHELQNFYFALTSEELSITI